MTSDLPSMGELEIQVLRLVWEHEPCTERWISEIIQDDGFAQLLTVHP